MPRAVWKGAIIFGLVHVPIALVPASQETGIDFDWLDQRSMDPVGYKRINKRTGKEIESEHIVKGIKQADGDYVILSDEQIKAAYPTATQTIDIEAFVAAAEIPFVLLERPYHLEPIGKAEKVYVLLREAMLAAGVIGIARVVISTREHLAALIPTASALMLNTLRWSSEIRAPDELKLPAPGRGGVKPAELKMATQLIAEMTGPWQPEAHAERFSAAINALVQKKIEAGQTQSVATLEDAPAAGSSNVVDLSALLAQSLAQRSKAAPAPAPKKRKRA